MSVTGTNGSLVLSIWDLSEEYGLHLNQQAWLDPIPYTYRIFGFQTSHLGSLFLHCNLRMLVSGFDEKLNQEKVENVCGIQRSQMIAFTQVGLAWEYRVKCCPSSSLVEQIYQYPNFSRASDSFNSLHPGADSRAEWAL
jgi:hypothetical protein